MHDVRTRRLHVVTMGCAKNVVDSERLMGQLRLNNFTLTASLEEADIAVINTCGFIDAAKAESIDMLVAAVKRKSRGRVRKVYAMGCLTERYREQLVREIPELDGVFGPAAVEEILAELGAEYRHDLPDERRLTTPAHFAWLKISEGCDNPCSFCAIPLMRGKHLSVPMERLVAEARALAARGVKELAVIGQDTTCYGVDLDGKRRLPELLDALAEVPGIAWVRLMYAFPAKFPREVLDVIASRPAICRYLDIPLQHASDEVLRSMRRGISARAQRDLLEEIRGRIPGIALRTTLIVGYPAETEAHFEELLEFVRNQRFERLGVFTYSPEEGTAAHELGDPVPAAEKERRRARIMEVQQEISLERNENLVGTVCRVLIDRKEGDRYVGRTEADAPEIDNEVFVESAEALNPGMFCDVEILDATEYDTYGRAIGPHPLPPLAGDHRRS